MTGLDGVALLSALYGAYEHPKPVPGDLGCRAVMLVDTVDMAIEARAAGWEPRIVPAPVPPVLIEYARRNDPSATAAMLHHKWWKLHPHLAVPDAEVTLWVDASILIKADRYAERCLEALGDDDLTTIVHPSRTCLYDEAAFSATLARYDRPALERQVAAYRFMSHPAGWGLFATGANVWRHTAAMETFGSDWWHEIVTYTHQDQVSLPVLLRLYGQPGNHRTGDPLRWNTRMPWDTWWGVYEHGRLPGM
jgi:hypothetical protein